MHTCRSTLEPASPHARQQTFSRVANIVNKKNPWQRTFTIGPATFVRGHGVSKDSFHHGDKTKNVRTNVPRPMHALIHYKIPPRDVHLIGVIASKVFRVLRGKWCRSHVHNGDAQKRTVRRCHTNGLKRPRLACTSRPLYYNTAWPIFATGTSNGHRLFQQQSHTPPNVRHAPTLAKPPSRQVQTQTALIKSCNKKVPVGPSRRNTRSTSPFLHPICVRQWLTH